MLQTVASNRNSSKYEYLIFVSGYSNLARDPNDVGSKCSHQVVAAFMLALQPGCFLVCQGWDEMFAYPLGDPLGPAITADGVMRRTFASGTSVEYDMSSEKANIRWAGHPAPAPAPRPAPPHPPHGPQCPGPRCPLVPRANYKGCFVDKTDGVCDLPVVPKQSSGHCPKGPHHHSGGSHFCTVEYCNALCAPLGKKFFGLQAGHACFCGDSFGSQGAATPTDCNLPCTGNTSETCGGLKRNTIFAVEPLSSL